MRTIRLLRILVPILLATTAIVLNLPAFESESWPALLTHGGLRPLLSAERQLRSNNYLKALEQFQIVALRSKRASQEGLFQKVRLRLANAGSTMSAHDLANAWSYLARYVLWSKDFNRSAGYVEDSLLVRAGSPTEFKYPLMDENGLRTFWGYYPVEAPLGLYRRYIPRRALGTLPGGLYNHTASDVPGNYDKAFVIPMAVMAPSPVPRTFLEISLREPSSAPWYMSVNNRIQWAAPIINGKTPLLRMATCPESAWYLDRLVALGGEPPFPIQAYLVHRYQSFSVAP